MANQSTIPDRVRGAAAERRRTQTDLANALGLSRVAVTRRLGGKVVFSANELVTLGAYLEVPVAKFFADEKADGGAPALAEGGDAA